MQKDKCQIWQAIMHYVDSVTLPYKEGAIG